MYDTIKSHLVWIIFALNATASPSLLLANLTANENNVQEPTLEQLYDFYSTNYEALIYQTHYQGPAWVARKKHFLRTDAHTILDLGCADGYIGRLLLSFNSTYHLSGIDFSRGMVQACKMKGGYREVIQADLNQGLPEALYDKTYDVVFALGCLEFIEQHDELFQQIHSLLSPNGQFWLTLQADHKEECIDNDVVAIYSKKDVQETLEKHGFKILDLELHNAGYVRSSDKIEVPYFLIIAEAI